MFSRPFVFSPPLLLIVVYAYVIIILVVSHNLHNSYLAIFGKIHAARKGN